MAASEPQGAVKTYGNWRRPQSAGILGLGSVGTGGLIGGFVLMVIAIMVGGLVPGFIVFALLCVAVGLVTVKDGHGRTVLQRAAARVGWWATRTQGEHLYRSGILGRTPWGTAQLPGIAAPTRLTEWQDSYSRPFALVESPASGTFSVILGTDPDGAALVDEDQVNIWVADWGNWLAALSVEPSLVAAAVTVETAPDTGTRLRREVASNLDPDAPEAATRMLQEVVDTYPAGASSVKAYVALTFTAAPRPGASRRKPDELARDLASRLPGLTESLSATGAGAVHPLDAQTLCETIRIAYDPAAATLISEAHASGQVPDLSWSDVGPVAAEAQWAGYRHDSGWSQTWEMTQAPRGIVRSSILTSLLAPHPDVARKRVTLLYEPVDTARAAALVENDRHSAEFLLSASSKPSARAIHSFRQADKTATEEAAGASLVNFGLLVTATSVDPARRADAAAVVDNLAASARIRLRPVYGSQDSAFAACLPLGLVLSRHMRVPAELRGKI
ncbi:SCO6880 family protein [Propionibacterium sp.]|uniref:SCO6880 family protein n=1 Tax=Propionibacterium sp. TaxID=1977903 RepID=UPI0039E84A09